MAWKSSIMGNLDTIRRNIYRKVRSDQDDIPDLIRSKMRSKGFIKQKVIKADDRRNEQKETIESLCSQLGIEVPEKYTGRKSETFRGVAFGPKLLQPGGAMFLNIRKPENMQRELAKATDKGAAVIFADRSTFLEAGLSESDYPVVLVDDAFEAFDRFYRPYRDAYAGLVIGITGSVGKTTTKRYIGAVTARKSSTFVSPANENSTFNVADNILSQMSGYKVFVQEIGASVPGSVATSARMLRPDVAVITNVMAHHLNTYGTIENVFEDKISLVTNLQPGGTAVVNFDDERLAAFDYSCRVISLGINTPQPVDYRAVNIHHDGTCLHMDVDHAGQLTHLQANLIGDFNAYNLLAAFAVGKLAGVPTKQIQEAVEEFKSSDTRQNLVTYGKNQFFMDCYNVSNDTIVNSVKVLENLDVPEGGRRIAGIGGENKLGKLRVEKTRELGKRLADAGVDQIVCYGTGKDTFKALNRYGDAKVLYESLQEEGFPDLKLITKFNELVKYLKQEVRNNDAVLFKTIVYLNMPAAVDKAFGTAYCLRTKTVLEKAEYQTIEGLTGFRIRNMKEVLITDADSRLLKKEQVRIPDEFDGIPVFGLDRGVFAYSRMKELDLGKSIKNIGTGAFRGCRNLQKVIIPDSVMHIMEGAFRDCSGLTSVEIGKGIRQIDKGAFQGCKSLKEVHIASADRLRIEDGAFPDQAEIKLK